MPACRPPVCHPEPATREAVILSPHFRAKDLSPRAGQLNSLHPPNSMLLSPRPMKAILFKEHGGPEVLQYVDVPEPTIGANDVLVRVRACALNHLDLWVRKGIPGRKIPLPHIPGSDISGEVSKIGANVTRVKPGDKVILNPGISCGQCPQCLSGNDNLCRQYGLFGEPHPGGCAEYVRSPEVNVVPMPPRLNFEEAAAIPLVFLTAWHMLITRAKLVAGETVVVLAAGSGVGSAAIQIAKAMSARIIATAGKEVKRLTNRRGADVVFEHVGAATWDQSVASLAAGGRLVTCGNTTGYDVHIDLRFLFSRQLSLLGSFMGSKAELYSVLELVNRGILNPVIDKIYPLEKAAEAHKHLEDRAQFGKVVLKVS